ncbi:hypothetical protein Tco_0167934 [Tanacetum coccineum]
MAVYLIGSSFVDTNPYKTKPKEIKDQSKWIYEVVQAGCKALITEETIKKNPLLTRKRWLLWLFQTLRGLASVEERLVFYKNNEVIFTDQIAVLKRDASINEAEIIALKSYIKKLKKEKEDNLLKINNYENATKSLDKVIGSQLVDNNKKGLGYNVVPPPPTGLFAPPIIDLSQSGIEKFKEPEFVGYGVKVDKIVSENSSVEIKKTPDAPIIEDWESDSDDEDDKPKHKVVKKTVDSKTVKQDVVTDGQIKKKTVFPTAAKIEVVKPKQQEKPVRKPVKYAEMYMSQSLEGIKEIGIIRSPIN